MESGRPGPDHQPHSRLVRPGPRDVRQRLAGLHDRRHAGGMGQCVAGGRASTAGGAAEEAVPRQRGPGLWVDLMHWIIIRLIWHRELRDLLRDRRWLFMLL